MILNRDLIIFGDDWGRYPSTIQHMGRLLARHNRILWIGSLGLRRPSLSVADAGRIVEKMKSIVRPSAQEHPDDSVFLLHPFVIPLHDNRPVRWMNTLLLTRSIRERIDQLQFRNPIILSSSPLIGSLIGRLGETSTHYFCLDDYSLFEGAFRNLRKMERELIEKSDTSFYVSESLKTQLAPSRKNAYLLPQGVDCEHFSRERVDIAGPVTALRHPVIGFFGLMAEWVDVDLIIRCATTYPDAAVVVIGKSAVDISAFHRVPNVLYLGEIPYSILPAYVKAFDVGLIPFRINQLTIAANPLKLLEYLAMGVPVVSSNLPEVARFGQSVNIATTDDDFIRMVGTCIERTKDVDRKEIRSVALAYSWNAVVDRVSQIVLQSETAAPRR